MQKNKYLDILESERLREVGGGRGNFLVEISIARIGAGRAESGVLEYTALDALMSKQSRRRRRDAPCAYRRRRTRRDRALSRLGSICQRFIRRSLRFPGSRGCTWSSLLPVHSPALPHVGPPSLLPSSLSLSLSLFFSHSLSFSSYGVLASRICVMDMLS